MHTNTHTHTHTHIHTYPHICARSHTHTHTLVHVHTHTHILIHPHAHTRTHTPIHTHTPTHMRTHTHTHARTRTQQELTLLLLLYRPKTSRLEGSISFFEFWSSWVQISTRRLTILTESFVKTSIFLQVNRLPFFPTTPFAIRTC